MKASIIICAYNEEKTISEVVISCCRENPDAEIIVVDDGSVDNTGSLLKELVKDHPFRYERLSENKGKSWAMVHGVEISANEIILFFDADVSNIKKDHFQQLLRPLLDDTSDMVLGQPSETLIDYRINPFSPLTGERALLKKDIMPILDDIREIRFGVETYLNMYYQANGKRIKYIFLEGLVHPTKFDKTTPMKATTEFLKEGKEIAFTMLDNYELIAQRIELHFNKANASALKKLDAMQRAMNKRLLELKNKLNL
ncbi:MAG TPA: glycosyltransferase family 2 protein [Bacteroidales bacterium]|nr:glycosyltransferase family 2 protein [Bacteroidales bacterium]HPT10767.1 glycosyltransferase family 2 protein [Bacteroidales bacterium]